MWCDKEIELYKWITNVHGSFSPSTNCSGSVSCEEMGQTWTNSRNEGDWLKQTVSSSGWTGWDAVITNLLFARCSTWRTQKVLSGKCGRPLAFKHHSDFAQCVEMCLEALTTFHQQLLNERRIKLIPFRLSTETRQWSTVQVRQHGLFQSLQVVLLCNEVLADRRHLTAEEFLATFHQWVDLVLLQQWQQHVNVLGYNINIITKTSLITAWKYYHH